MNSHTRVWEIKIGKESQEFRLPDQSSLDAITGQLPEGFYTTFRTYAKGRRVIGLKAHLQRLYQPVSSSKVNEVDLRKQLAPLLKEYPDEARLRLIMTRSGEIYVAIEPLKPLPREVYLRGVRVITTDLKRNHPRLKLTGFIQRSAGEREHIDEEGLFEALLVKRGRILEGLTSNFFYIKDDLLGTAQQDILLGVTRRTVIRLARQMGIQVICRPLRREHIGFLQEAFITSSSRGLVPVIQIDDVIVGQGTPGRITKQLSAAYEAYVLQKAEMV